ncbi:aquaporin-like [Anopheles darlingi]|uniref:aquaporin-like n=1 Tax=Anopheles darlingi TaxID=43151 RepID=UPI00210053ED|nr:aquaporin-like [Anopheles darlingi]
MEFNGLSKDQDHQHQQQQPQRPPLYEANGVTAGTRSVQEGWSFDVVWQTKISNTTSFDVLVKFLGEFFGTATLMFLGCMGCLDGFDNATSNFSRGIVFGFTVMIVILTFGVVSGAHINPVVSIAAYIYGDLSAMMTLVYFVAQFAGAICGYGLLMAVAPATYFDDALVTGRGSCVTAPHDSLSTGSALAIEFLVTGILIWSCCGVWDPRNAKHQDSGPLKFALLVAAISVAAGPATGASMNPARTLAPCLWNNSYHKIWIYFVGPPLAGIVMPIFYKYIFRKEVTPDSATEAEPPREQVCVCVVHNRESNDVKV